MAQTSADRGRADRRGPLHRRPGRLDSLVAARVAGPSNIDNHSPAHEVPATYCFGVEVVSVHVVNQAARMNDVDTVSSADRAAAVLALRG